MSTSSVANSGSGALSSLPGSALQITGLASGLDTNQIISELMSIQQVPITALQSQQSGLAATNAQLTGIQSSLQTLAADAQALGSSSLYSSSQPVTSSNAGLVSASATTTGAGVGGYQVSVSQLANSARRTFSYSSPATADAITIDGHATNIPAGASLADFVQSINSDSSATVYASATDAGTVVFSNRATGDTGSNFIQVAGAAGALTEQTSLAREGQDAQFTVDGTPGSSSSNTVTSAIAGVTLTLSGVTTTAGPATINVGAPQANQGNISSAISKFVSDYNSTITRIQTQLSQVPSSSDVTQGTLFGDPGLSDLLSSMRSAMYGSGAGLPTGMATMMDIGVSTGASTGTAAFSQSAVSGNLTLTAATLTAALQSNPTGVQSMLQSWSTGFSSLVNNEAQSGGSIDARIQGDTTQSSALGVQISNLQSALTDKQAQLTQQFAALEGTLSQNQSEASWLTSQLAALPTV